LNELHVVQSFDASSGHIQALDMVRQSLPAESAQVGSEQLLKLVAAELISESLHRCESTQAEAAIKQADQTDPLLNPTSPQSRRELYPYQ
jgi:hypothetical protein